MRNKKAFEDLASGYKQCTACTQILTIDKFRLRTNRGKQILVARCRKCDTHFSKLQKDKDKARERERMRNSIPEVRDRKNKYEREWRAKNIEKNREYHRKHIKKQVDTLSDLYVQRTAFRNNKNVSEKLIDVKRLHILIKREIKKHAKK